MTGWPRLTRQVPPQVLQQERPLRERRRRQAGPVQLRAEEHGGAPASANADFRGFFIFIFNVSLLVSQVFSRMSLGELETLISEQEQLASAADPERDERPEHAEVLDVRLRETHNQEQGGNKEFLRVPALVYAVFC